MNRNVIPVVEGPVPQPESQPGVSPALVRAKVATLPDGCTWGMVLAMSMLCGIGFTVSLFIGNLAFGAGGEEAAQARLGVLTGAVVAGVMGCVAMLLANSMRGFARPAGERLSSGQARAR